MQATHQSFTESLEAHLQLFGGDRDKKFILSHRNCFELGTDCFNEDLYLCRDIIAYLEGNTNIRLPEYALIDIARIRAGFDVDQILEVLRNACFPKIGERIVL
jgi:hypothetical protein